MSFTRAPPVTALITLCKPVTMADNWSNKQEDGHASHRRSGSSLRSKSSRSAVGQSLARTRLRHRRRDGRCDEPDSAAPQSDGMAQEPATALLIVDLDKHIGSARAWRDTFGEQLPDLEIRISPDAANLADIGKIRTKPGTRHERKQHTAGGARRAGGAGHRAQGVRITRRPLDHRGGRLRLLRDRPRTRGVRHGNDLLQTPRRMY